MALATERERRTTIEENVEAEFDAEYISGYKGYPNSTDSRVLLFSHRIEIEKLYLKIPYSHITDIRNVEEKKISARRVVLFGVAGALWKEKHLYTVIEYKDDLEGLQTLLFDFGKNIDKAQPLIYQKMLTARSRGY